VHVHLATIHLVVATHILSALAERGSAKQTAYAKHNGCTHPSGAAYRQYHTASGGYFVPHRLPEGKVRRLLVRQPGWKGLLSRRVGTWPGKIPHLLSVADIAALWHLPQAQNLADLPYVERARARTALVLLS